MEMLDNKLTPVLVQLLTLPPRNDNHPDVQRLYNWLTEPERSAEEFHYVIGTLQNNVHTTMNYSGNSFYVAKTGLEALAFRSPVLKGPWELVVGSLISVFHDCRGSCEYGPGSNRLNDWIIRVVGDPAMCPSSDLRFQLLNLYQKILKITKVNRKRALESLMSVCSSLERNGNMFGPVMTDDLIDYLTEFTDDNYLQKYSLGVVKKLKQQRKSKNKFATTDMWEVRSLIALLQYISEGATVALSDVREDNHYDFHWRNFDNACIGLLFMVCNFKAVLQEPELIEWTAESIMAVMESVVLVTWDLDQDRDPQEEFYRGSLKWINKFLDLFCNDVDGAGTVDETPIGLEIIMKNKQRICCIRDVISPEFVDDYFLGERFEMEQLLIKAKFKFESNYGEDHKLLHICNLLYNNHY